MRKYQIELVNDPTDPNEPPYPREVFESRRGAMDAAAFRCANHGLAFRVLHKLANGTLKEIAVFTPSPKISKHE